MRTLPSLQEWNRQSVNVMQALLGRISPNFRMVSLGHNGAMWTITFVLETPDAEDMEELDDFGTEWEALQDGPTPCDLSITISAEPLARLADPERALYWRREVIGFRFEGKDRRP